MPDPELQDFGRAFRRFLDAVTADAGDSSANEVVRLVRGHLGEAGVATSVVGRRVDSFDHVNLQGALDAWSDRDGRVVNVRGLALPPHWGGLSLQQLITGEGLPPVRLSAPVLADLPSGPGRSRACLTSALLLVEDADGRSIVLLSTGEHEPGVLVEVAGLPVERAQALHAELARLRSELNVYRGQVVELTMTDSGQLQLLFADLPVTRREDVVLPEPVLRRVERHALSIAEHREALLAAGQHLKRGLLLHGPPGTGKTHTTRYLVGRLPGATRLLLAGRALHAIGAVASLARELEPAVVVLEDVDLVAEERDYGGGSSPVLFELLDAMDGAAGDADLLFLLTTNRADVLEPALATRPGRVDVAVEIGLPDADGRARLLALYGASVPLQLSPAEADEVVSRCEGTTASFVKELLRRAVLEALTEDPSLSAVTAVHVRRALDDLLGDEQEVTRALLGVPRAGGDPDLDEDEEEPW